MDSKELICIGCPMGCNITVTFDSSNPKTIKEISGFTCSIGEKYATNEILAPSRNITTSVYVESSDKKMCSVKTNGNIPKEKILDCVRMLKNVKIKAPVRIGDVVLKNVCDTGVDIIATRNIG